MLRCRGACGNAQCAYATNDSVHFHEHTNPQRRARQRKRRREKVACPICQQQVTLACLTRHKKRKHNLQPRQCLRCPQEMDKHAFRFIKRLVCTSIATDVKKMQRWSEADRRQLRALHTNQAKQQLAVAVHKRYTALQDTDDHGGRCSAPCAIVLQPHSLFSLTLDRKDNARPHFVEGTLRNLCFTCRGMNVHSSLREWYTTSPHDTMCGYLRAEMHRHVSSEEIEDALHREQHSRSSTLATRYGQKTRHNTLYKSVINVFHHDPLARGAFQSVKHMFEYVYHELYVKQGARCQISSIFLSGHAYNRIKADTGGRTFLPHCFQPSLDAVQPSLGHVRGNMRIVAVFLNATDTSKQDAHQARKNADHGAIPHAWTRKLWAHYVGCGPTRKPVGDDDP